MILFANLLEKYTEKNMCDSSKNKWKNEERNKARKRIFLSFFDLFISLSSLITKNDKERKYSTSFYFEFRIDIIDIIVVFGVWSSDRWFNRFNAFRCPQVSLIAYHQSKNFNRFKFNRNFLLFLISGEFSIKFLDFVVFLTFRWNQTWEVSSKKKIFFLSCGENIVKK